MRYYGIPYYGYTQPSGPETQTRSLLGVGRKADRRSPPRPAAPPDPAMGLQRPGRLRRGSRRQSAPGRLRLLACAAVPAVLGALAGCGEAFAGETRVPARALRPSAEQAAPDARSASAGSTTRVARRFMPKGKEEKKVVIANAGTSERGWVEVSRTVVKKSLVEISELSSQKPPCA